MGEGLGEGSSGDDGEDHCCCRAFHDLSWSADSLRLGSRGMGWYRWCLVLMEAIIFWPRDVIQAIVGL